MLLLIITGCNQSPPKASFSVQPRQAMVGEKIHFTNNSEGFLRSMWSFGDEGVSRDRDPDHIYYAPGDYQVSLMVYNRSSSDAIGLKVTIREPEVPVHVHGVESDTGRKYLFTAVTPLPVRWTVDDQQVSEDSILIHLFPDTVSQRIALYIQGSEYLLWDSTFASVAERGPVARSEPVTPSKGAETSQEKSDPSARITASVKPIKVLLGNEITYTCDAISGVIWDFNGEQRSEDKSGRIIFGDTGTKTITLKDRSSGRTIKTFKIEVFEETSSQEVSDILNSIANDGLSRSQKREIAEKLYDKSAGGKSTRVTGQGTGTLEDYVNKLMIESSSFVKVSIRAEVKLDDAGAISEIYIVQYMSREN